MRRCVILLSPYRGPTPEAREENVAYARRCLLDSLMRGEAPLAPHLLHTQVLDDDDQFARGSGIAAGQAWFERAEAVVVYADLGTSPGMELDIRHAKALHKIIETRTVGWPTKKK